MKRNRKKVTQLELIKEYYRSHAGKDVPHYESVPWLYSEYEKRTGKKFADPDRGIRSLADKGFLIYVKKGIYKYNENYKKDKNLNDFTQKQKEEIKKRDGFKCVVCGRGEKDGIELHVDHIDSRQKGGEAISIENGMTLCGQHNYWKRNLGQTESAKKMFIKFYNLAKKRDSKELTAFFSEILSIYEKHDVNGHIVWEK
ncbi:MAG: HNH endonuclease [Candidatus Magasanikbacteria bacterium RIFCSPLOWO2_02_FULL_44_11]|uniref:HNH endonuclease n=1 Tax=Candidatus Magasanikbacteria bacterium RIFCSPLOWO2_02_FULL_44_11 TaxID=1798689 RepID=A0A1F6NAH7_9BACT|nr:MAG: HNH endonuclease [Candidatus Magasanikbacteria bacterium RIFCSPLOWO2_02_FULL_44_11]